MDTTPAPLVLVGHLQTLADHDVSYLIIGGVAGRLQGSPATTGDLDIIPEPDLDNLERLARALSTPSTRKKPIDGRQYIPHPVVRSSEFWSEQMLQYETAHGGIDVLMELPGVGSYDVIVRRARRYDLRAYRLSVQVANLDDVITSKEFGDDYELPPEALDVQLPLPGHDPDEFDQHP